MISASALPKLFSRIVFKDIDSKSFYSIHVGNTYEIQTNKLYFSAENISILTNLLVAHAHDDVKWKSHITWIILYQNLSQLHNSSSWYDNRHQLQGKKASIR